MNKSPIDEYNANTIGLSQRFSLSQGLQAAAKAMGATRDGEVKIETGNAIRYLTEFLGDIQPVADMNKREGEFSQAVHTYFRKYCDDPITTLLYRFIADSIGLGVWTAFVKGAVANKLNYQEALRAADCFCNDSEHPNDGYMFMALKSWPKKDYNRMIDTFREDKYFSWLPKAGKLPANTQFETLAIDY